MENELVLSHKDFRAFSSETRNALLKRLLERNHTITELGKKLSLAPPTIKQHLDILAEAGLVEEMPGTRKWKYYTLTRKGKKVLGKNAGEQHIIILLGMTSVLLLALLLSLTIPPHVSLEPDTARSAAETLAGTRALGTTTTQTAARPGLQPALVIALTLIALLEGYLIARVR